MTAKIKLNAASGGGSVSIQAPSSSSNNRVISLPDIADGTLVTSESTLDATKLSGNLPALNGSALTGMTVTITPSSSSNKILIVTNLTYGGESNGYFGVNLLRGSTQLGLSTAATGSQLNFTFAIGTGNGDNDYYKCHNASHAFLDSPATTSATTYKLQGYSYDSRYFYLNRGHSVSNAAYIHSSTSSISAYEITV